MSKNTKSLMEVILMSGSAYDYLLNEYLNESIYDYLSPEEFTEVTDGNKDNDKNETENFKIPF